MNTILFFASGFPKGQPRTKAFRRGNHTGVFTPGTADAWKANVREAAHPNMPLAQFEGPLSVVLTFTLPRPKAHFTKKGLRPNAPEYHTGKPDADNLAKAVLDALGDMQAFWRDDAQVARLIVVKTYGERAGCWVRIAPCDAALIADYGRAQG
jgi:Holliday junction resolvase RusA-like endonuclease